MYTICTESPYETAQSQEITEIPGIPILQIEKTLIGSSTAPFFPLGYAFRSKFPLLKQDDTEPKKYIYQNK